MKKFLLSLVSGILILSMLAGPAGADSQEAVRYYNEALDQAYLGNYEVALQSVDMAIRNNENFTLAWVTKAGIQNAMGRYNDSLVSADQAIVLNPDLPYAWINRATALIHLGQNEEALNASERASMLDPESPEAWINTGTALINLGRYEEAVNASERALAFAPASADAMENLEKSRALLKNPEQTYPVQSSVTPAGKTPLAVIPVFSALFISCIIALACRHRADDLR
jgi:Putative Zn-dependent protease, contains TPR repeats